MSAANARSSSTVVKLPTAAGRTRSPDSGSNRRSIGRTVTHTNRAVNAAVGSITDAATAGVRAAARRLTEETGGSNDDWGRDPGLVRNMMALGQLRWDVSTGGDQHLPSRAGALVVVNSPRVSPSAMFTAFAISQATDRPVRFVARRDHSLVGSFNRRIGGLIDHPDEIAGALRAKQIVVISAASSSRSRDVGVIDHTLIGAALATGTRVFPAATTSRPLARPARVEIGPACRPPRKRRGPLSEFELAEQLRTEIKMLLDEMGDIVTGTPLDWLPLSGMGGH